MKILFKSIFCCCSEKKIDSNNKMEVGSGEKKLPYLCQRLVDPTGVFKMPIFRYTGPKESIVASSRLKFISFHLELEFSKEAFMPFK